MAFRITAATERVAFEPIPFTYNGERTTIIVSSRDAVGRGATATVLKGTLYKSTGIKIVALKVHGAILTDRQRLTLHREMEVWRMVVHPRILPFYGTCDISSNQLALVSPYMDNGNLCEYIARNNNCDRLQLIHQVARGLHYLHRSGFVHGDIKSENVLVDSDGEAVIADFGLSTSVYSMSEDAPTATFIRERKTVKFSAPELFLDEAVDHEITYRVRSKTRMSDVYAFGALIYQVYSGSPPWRSLNDRNVLLRVCRGERPDRPPHPHLTDEIWDLCHRCWKHIPGDRPSMYIVLLELTALVVNSQGQPASSRRLNSTAPEFAPYLLSTAADVHLLYEGPVTASPGVSEMPRRQTLAQLSPPAVTPLLARNPSGPPELHFDVQYASTGARLDHDSRPLNPLHRDLRAFLCTGSSTMRIQCDLYPWSFDISTEASVGEFLKQLSDCLWKRVTSEDWERLDDRNQAKLHASFSARVARAERYGAQVHRLHSDGILRLDWLQGHTIFHGLEITADPHTLKVAFGHHLYGELRRLDTTAFEQRPIWSQETVHMLV